MKAFRCRLRLAVIAWLSFQVVTLSALVPRDCCDAHRPALLQERCHESPASSYCPMRSQGRSCPMHAPETAAAADPHAHHGGSAAAEPSGPEHDAAGHRSDDQPERPASDGQCSVGGHCDAPIAALSVILSTHGVVPAEVQIHADTDPAKAPRPLTEHLTSLLAPPDSPPPRA